jgi:hypothetical protein
MSTEISGDPRAARANRAALQLLFDHRDHLGVPPAVAKVLQAVLADDHEGIDKLLEEMGDLDPSSVHVNVFRNASDWVLTAEPNSYLDEILRSDPDYELVSEGTPRPPEPRRVHWFSGAGPRPDTEIEAPL